MHRLLVILMFKSVDEILWCCHSNKTFLAQLLYSTIHFFKSCKKEFECFVNFFLCHYWSKGLSNLQSLAQETEENYYWIQTPSYCPPKGNIRI